MDKLKTTTHQEGSKTVYNTVFTCEGDIQKIFEYLKTNQTPRNVPITTISVDVKDNQIKRVMTCPLPDNFQVRLALGNQPVYVTYNIQCVDTIIAITAVNPDVIHKFFRFTEEMIVDQIRPGVIQFERKAKVYNTGKRYISSSYQEYDDYYNNQTLGFCLGLSEAAR